MSAASRNARLTSCQTCRSPLMVKSASVIQKELKKWDLQLLWVDKGKSGEVEFLTSSKISRIANWDKFIKDNSSFGRKVARFLRMNTGYLVKFRAVCQGFYSSSPQTISIKYSFAVAALYRHT